ncbi:endonuclease domain-containing protein [Lolliginicoccus levis]|uniref:endonuclease domain-containing protein n=1 Tax=Lolliginicoccus levis TaxID=2919542 RepID=UPI00241BFD76|nr:DUF559 domain-containing protein [Lolliginicoccus levis]
MLPKKVVHALARHDGVITRSRALELGMSRHQVDGRVATGEWRCLQAGVYIPADRPVTTAARLRAAVLAAGPGAVARGPSAAWWHGVLDDPSAVPLVMIPRDRRACIRDAKVLRRDIPAADRTRLHGVAVVSRELAILETAVSMPDGSVFLDRALQRHTLLPSLIQAHERNLPRRGGARSAWMLAIAATGGASEAERLLVRALRGTGITGWRLHVRSHGFEIDLAFERERVAIEVDGWAWHRDAGRFAHDLQRQNTLVNAGWHVLRFGWHRLAHDPSGVLSEIRTALNRARRERFL